MPFLSGLFGSDSSSDQNSDLTGVLDSALSLDASYSHYDQSTDSDGSSHTSANSGSIGTDFHLDSVLSSLTDSMGMGDHGGGGLLGG